MYKPKILINVIPIDHEARKIFIAKRTEDSKLNIVSGKLKYSEDFDQAALRLMKEDLNIQLEDKSELKYICSYNIIDKEASLHFVGILFSASLSKVQIKGISLNKGTFQSYTFATIEEIRDEIPSLNRGLQEFLTRFNIRSLDDVLTLVSN